VVRAAHLIGLIALAGCALQPLPPEGRFRAPGGVKDVSASEVAGDALSDTDAAGGADLKADAVDGGFTDVLVDAVDVADIVEVKGEIADTGADADVPGGADAVQLSDSAVGEDQDAPDSLSCTVYYLDADGDGYGKLGDNKCIYAASGKYKVTGVTAGNADCDDTAAAVHPGATEVCDNMDNNCAGSPAIDEGCDDDNDNYCDAGMAKVAVSVSTCTASATAAWAAGAGGALSDCNDGCQSCFPGHKEVCDGKDNDCAGGVDNGMTLADSTCLTVGVCAGTTSYTCDGAPGTWTCDYTSVVGYSATEVCSDALDNNCNGQTDEAGCACGDQYLAIEVDGAVVCAPDYPVWGIEPLTPAGLTDNGDQTVSDSLTGRTWQKADSGGTSNWADAKAYCQGLTLAGFSNWRLPTRTELLTITDFNKVGPAVAAVFVPSTSSTYYWSASPLQGSSSVAWLVYFNNGYSDYDGVTYTYRVRCVR